ncbi:hypothetical protein QN277_005327 [Acacia crassicarpa]|uniref:xylose isomerase n=1 Tax=Acacia crassicarpa TaxID=499986 RepID=A0AAE1IY05_9FABA|nr:hypothetical protein QN277_005327 [Acacia crassicarpa]
MEPLLSTLHPVCSTSISSSGWFGREAEASKARSETMTARVLKEADLWVVWPRGSDRSGSTKSRSEMVKSEINYGYRRLGEGEIFFLQDNLPIPQNGGLGTESDLSKEASFEASRTSHLLSLVTEALKKLLQLILWYNIYRGTITLPLLIFMIKFVHSLMFGSGLNVRIPSFSLFGNQIADSQTCPATNIDSCSDGWEGEFFPGIPQIKYEGPSSKNPLAFKYYNAEEEVLGKKMKDWFRFSVAFWHTFRGTGGDPFGAPTKS